MQTEIERVLTMKKIRTIILIITLIFTLAVPNVSAKPKDDTEPDNFLVALGDSQTFGEGLQQHEGIPSKQSYPFVMGAMFAERDGEPWEVNNHAVSGYRTQDVLNDLMYNPIVIEDVMKADVIILNIGANDFLHDLIAQALEARMQQQPFDMESAFMNGVIDIIDNLPAILHAIKVHNPGAEVILYTMINPFTDHTVDVEVLAPLFETTPEALLVLFAQFDFLLDTVVNPIYYHVAMGSMLMGQNIRLAHPRHFGFGSETVHRYLRDYTGDEYNFEFMIKDVHPNPKGHKVLAQIGFDAPQIINVHPVPVPPILIP